MFLHIISIIMYCNSCCNVVTVPETFYFPIIAFAQRALTLQHALSLISLLTVLHSLFTMHSLSQSVHHSRFNYIHHSPSIHSAFTYCSKGVYSVFISFHHLSKLLSSKLIHHSIFLKITSFKLC